MTHSSRTLISRALPGVAVLAVVSLVTGCGSSDDTASDATPSPTADAYASAAAAATTWSTSQLGDAGVLETMFEDVAYPDLGLTTDLLLAQVATGDAGAADLAATLSTPENVAAYVGDGKAAQYAGPTAKLAAALDAAGSDPRDVGGRDLLTELGATLQDSGRFSDQGGDDYSQTISQAWGVLAQAVAGDGADASAVSYLLAQQCDDGGFSPALDAEACTSDVDATSFAVSALVAADAGTDEVVDAAAWLEQAATTDDDGEYWSTGDPAAPSVNSTAVAATALQDADQGAADALAWVSSFAVTEGDGAGALTLAGEPDVRSTTQGALALAGTGLAGLFD